MRLGRIILLLLVASACTGQEATGVLQPSVVRAWPDSAATRPDTTRTYLETLALGSLSPAEQEAFGQASSLDQIQYLIDRKELEIARLQARQARLFVLIIFLLAVIATLFWYFQARRILAQKALAEEKAESERLLSVAEDLRARLSARQTKRPERDVLERLCEQYYIYEGTDNLKPKILGEVGALIDTLRRDSSFLLDEEGAAAVDALRPVLKEEDLRLYAYLSAGLSATTISTLMGRDKSNIYNRVHRLKARLSEMPDGTHYLDRID